MDKYPNDQTLSEDRLKRLYNRLYEAYGPQHWWPADTRFEVIVGAVLTQNTAWVNVEKAIAGLWRLNLLTLDNINRLDQQMLAVPIRPSGYFNVKARRLKNLCAWVAGQGGMEALEKLDTPGFRAGLLGVNGIGPETADDILLYAFDRPVFVVDTYTRRLLAKLGLVKGDEDYETLRLGIEANLEENPALFNEYHALIVRHAKQRCDGAGDCRHCYVEGTFG